MSIKVGEVHYSQYPLWACIENTDGNVNDCASERYWEMGFFEPVSSMDKSKYVLMVNRRCYPDENQGDGDLRNLYIKFNANELPDYNNWIISDVNESLTTSGVKFNKNSNLYIDLGTSMRKFAPGEGKLFKLEPIPQSGGTLACDEYITGETINVQDTIFTNGHTLRIGFGTTLNFSDSGCIVVNGGSLICGDINQPTHARDIFFKGNNCNWSGIVLQDCDTVNINSVQFQNIKGDQNNNNYQKRGMISPKFFNCYI